MVTGGRRAGGSRSHSGSNDPWVQRILADVYEAPMRAVGAEFLMHRILTKVTRRNGIIKMTVTFPELIAPCWTARGSWPKMTTIHRSDDDATTAAYAARCSLATIQKSAFMSIMQHETDPYAVVDDDVPLAEMHCPGIMTRFLETHGVDIDQLDSASETGGYMNGWDQRGDKDIYLDHHEVRGLPETVPAFYFRKNDGWITDFRTRLAPDVILVGDTIVLQGTQLPETRISGMKGMHINDIVKHPLFDVPGLVVRSVRNNRHDVRIAMDMRDDGNVIGGYDRYLPGNGSAKT